MKILVGCWQLLGVRSINTEKASFKVRILHTFANCVFYWWVISSVMHTWTILLHTTFKFKVRTMIVSKCSPPLVILWNHSKIRLPIMISFCCSCHSNVYYPCQKYTKYTVTNISPVTFSHSYGVFRATNTRCVLSMPISQSTLSSQRVELLLKSGISWVRSMCAECACAAESRAARQVKRMKLLWKAMTLSWCLTQVRTYIDGITNLQTYM